MRLDALGSGEAAVAERKPISRCRWPFSVRSFRGFLTLLVLAAAGEAEAFAIHLENVDVVDARHIVVGNDNNLPFSSSRDPNKADDNELVLLEVEALLKAR